MKLVSCLVLITLAVLAACDPPPGLANFNCTPLSPPPAPAQDVRSIHPHDVKVMMAMGDSITAGFGMHEKYIFDGIQEYRGDVYSIGGNGDVASGTYTIPNFFEAVTGSKPLGYSKGQEAPWGAADFNYHNPDVDQLDAAQSGALTPQLDGQVDYLIKQLHATDGVDFDNDWKILTIFIGTTSLFVLV
uniref:Uncharacterized protein n=1 Tax=Palpitomonas bilix TaxID=652834 RepID=A0A7S3CZ62_9EUKA|mmetsp:Transcript_15516/g.39295  ORF Transcript_15516/g.39295 Transcript_15516/m.39295 type:complete len:188 (+) Transcript_15516:108-671(+)